MTQRQPRVEDPAHLAAVRRLPCLICAKPGPNDAAHIRSGSPLHKKRNTGFGEKASDMWTLPLCRAHHDEQHSGNELAFWRRHGINPFIEAKRLYGDRSVEPRLVTVRKVRARKPPGQRAKVRPSAKLQGRAFPEVSRPMGSRSMKQKRVTI